MSIMGHKRGGGMMGSVRGGEVFVNTNDPGRNAGRITHLKQILSKMPTDHPDRASFERELQRRVFRAQENRLKGGQ